MLDDDEINLVAQVVAARAMLRQDQLSPGAVTAAYDHLLKIPEAECDPDLDPRVEELDRGAAVEYGVKRLMINGAQAAWPLLVRIVELCPRDRRVLGSIGAGLFEDWVTEERVRAVEVELSSLLKSDPKWRVVAEESWDAPASLARLLSDPKNLPSVPL
jgi:hypothetical protein